MSIRSKIQALIAAANTKTGESDATLTDAVQTLVDGYGQGGGEWTTNGLADRSEPSGALLINNNKGIYNNAFYNGKLITSVHIANVDPKDMGGSAFAYCTNLTTFVATNVNTWAASAVQGCSKLTTIDVKIRGTLVNYGFQQCANLSTIVMRRPDATTTLQGVQCFYGTPFASGGAGGTLYVPQALIANYQSATNWSTILGYANNQILPIEGSIYETQYADGTPIAA
jgi:hypothetical protein